MSRHFRDILETGADTVRVQPGVVYQDLNLHLARFGRRFAPDPASGDRCTIGGMLANNASGARALRHGYTRDYVHSLRIILDTGDPATVGRESRLVTEGPAGHVQDIVLAVVALLEQNTELLHKHQPRTPFNRCGYQLHDVLDSKSLDVARLLVGSEGTLALFTEATLKTTPLPGGQAVVLLGFASLDAALTAATICSATKPTACELIERRLLTVARGGDPSSAALTPGVEVVLLVEYEADTAVAAAQQAADLAARFHNGDHPALQAVIATEPAEIERLWRIRGTALPSLYGSHAMSSPVPFVEDVAVPVDALPAYLHRVQETLQHFETTATFLVHAGTGQVHTRPFLDLHDPADISRLFAIAESVHTLALDLGGTVSSQHATGLARTPWVARQYGPLYPVLREVKAIFDPKRIFNPGKIIGPSPDVPAWPLRRQPTTPPDRLGLRWQPGEIVREARNCNGCGACRTGAKPQRMCPIFRATGDEAASPRAKANLMRHLLQEGATGGALAADEVRTVADLCVNCKMCATECPAAVNIPKLMLEAKAANVAEHGLSRSDWFFARSESFAVLGSALAPLVNFALSRRSLRWLLEKSFGLSRRRRMPTFAARCFLERAERHGWTVPRRSDRPQVAYFIDVFANYNDPAIAEATVAVLRHNGFDVIIPPDQVGCGMAALAQGDVENARSAARANLRQLVELAREGVPILCSEPSAALMLRKDYLDLLDDADAPLVSAQTVEATAFLGDLHAQGRLRTDLQPLRVGVGHHVPCHIKALGQRAVGPALLSLIPGMRVRTIDVSCSGMAGMFGFHKDNYEVSRAAGRPMFTELAHPGVLFGSTECSACRIQMEDGSGKRTLHPLQYLALSYGLMPGLRRRLQEPMGQRMLR
jgi:FAD/FMN-containing dehydrogenase/Fe-S oxidoreductase